ncbi:hypothetical protein ABMY26_00685 (plasmid) [Azospirillum sp. HJ39]|uniref:hypothetical protein n=1 Tax=Azospirillum sp. HJ39 TaxID=3159496 RepID=UPI003555FCAF
MLKLVTVNGQRVERPLHVRSCAVAPFAPGLMPFTFLWAPLAAFSLWWRCASLLLPYGSTALPHEASPMTDSAATIQPEQVVPPRYGKGTVLHLLRTLEADLEAVDGPAGELDAIQSLGLVLSSVGLITNDACLDMNEMVNERRLAGMAAADLVDAVLLFRPADWGYCTWKDTFRGQGYCAHVYPPVLLRRDSGVPAITKAHSELMAAARAIVQAWAHVTGEQP